MDTAVTAENHYIKKRESRGWMGHQNLQAGEHQVRGVASCLL